MEGLREMNMINPYNETNGPRQTGFCPAHGSLRNGLRCSTAKAYLRPSSKRKNLHISMNTYVEKILIDDDDKVAYGVLFSKEGRRHYVFASKEVILSAGAINSPHLLKLSGIGPKNELQRHSIDVIKDVPGVGENLMDHIAAGGSTFLVQNPVSNVSMSYVFSEITKIDSLREFIFENKGLLKGLPICEVIGFFNTKYQDTKQDWPDLQMFIGSFAEVTDGGLYGKKGAGMSTKYYEANYEQYLYKDAFLMLPLLMRPKSRGRLLLRSRNPRDYIQIFPNYFEDPHDLDVLVSLNIRGKSGKKNIYTVHRYF
jgi:glucose dehydrogenase (acceptor)